VNLIQLDNNWLRSLLFLKVY